MKGFIANRKWRYCFLVALLSLAFFGIITGCGGSDSSSSRSVDNGGDNQPGGSIAFSVKWEDPDRNPNARAAPLDCEEAGVAEVTAEVYGYEIPYDGSEESETSISPDRTETDPTLNGSEVLLTSGGPWECADHSASIDNVPAGTERRVVVKGIDAAGNTIYRGEAVGLSVESGAVTEAGLIEAFAMLSIDFRYLQYRTYTDSSRNEFRGDIELSKAGRPILPREVRKIELKDGEGNAIPTQAPEFYQNEHFLVNLNPDTGEVEFTGPYQYSDYAIRFPEGEQFSEGDYTYVVTTASGQVLNETFYYPGRVETPVTPLESMRHEWLSDGALRLSWTNPPGDYDQINILIWDEEGNDLVYTYLPPDTEEVTLSAQDIEKINTLHSPIEAQWIIRNRSFTDENMNFARSYSETLDIPWNSITIDFRDYFPLAVGDERLKSNSFGGLSKEKIGGIESIDGVQAYQLAYFDEDYANMTEIDDMDLFSYDDSNFYYHGYRQVGDPPGNDDPLGLYRHNVPLQYNRFMMLGDSLSDDTDMIGPNGVSLRRYLAVNFLGFEDIETPYGFFPNCARFLFEDDVEGEEIEEAYEWLAKGVGPVKIEPLNTGSPTDYVEQLENTTIIGNVDNLSIPWPPQFQYKTYSSSSQNRFGGWIAIKKNGIGANREDIADIKLRKSDYTEIPISLSFNDYFYYGASWNDSSSEFEFWGPRYEKDWGVSFADNVEYETGYYVWEAISLNGEVATYRFYFPGKKEMPIHDSTLMNYEWLSDGSLKLRWANPAGDYDRIQIALKTQDGRDVFYSTFDHSYDIEEIIIPADGIAETRSKIDNFTSIQWTMRTRARTAEGVNYARGYSDEVNIPFDQTAPTAPTNITATAGNGQVSLAWSQSGGASSYLVSKGESPGSYDTTFETTANSYIFTDLNNGVTYYFAVTAVNSFGESPPSAEVSATPSASASPDTFVNSFGMNFARIPSGTFTMGSPTSELGRSADEIQHEVTLTQDFYMMTTEVTQEQYLSVMGNNPSINTSCGDNCPVENVTWDDAQAFISTLSNIEDRIYRLPTEAEWEYAARAGSTTAFANGDITQTNCTPIDPNLDAMDWYCGNSNDTPHPVAQKQPNDWGLYDMHGNIREWCQDWFGDYPVGPVTDPVGPTTGTGRVIRGGSWFHEAYNARSASRGVDFQAYQNDNIGFRVVISNGL